MMPDERMPTPLLLILGTRNKKKGQEMAELVSPLGLTVKTLLDVPGSIEVEETGTTFVENARLKASEQAKHLKQWVLADDSGLAVDALGGRPGVYSARYSGDGATDASNNQLLLKELAGVPLEKRTAHYVCQFALADPQGNIRGETTGECHGRILMEEKGSNGFGYDPMFEIIEYHHTFGELGSAVKAALSHRARAARALLPQLAALLHSGW